VANSAISNIKIAEMPASLSLKFHGSIHKWHPDKAKDEQGEDKKRKSEPSSGKAAAKMPPRPKTPPGKGARQPSGAWQPAKEATHRMAKILENAKERLRNDTQERDKVEKAMSRMNMAPSEQQSMKMAASALAMEALYKDRSSSGRWDGNMNKNMAASVTELVKQYR
jgi:hypothetical protein